jgi:very-short-patch-repair endonuclease
LKLAIEIDRDSHFTEGADSYDKERQSKIESYGIEFLRFTNDEIYNNLGGVIGKIEQRIEATSPGLSLPKRGLTRN